ncbi:MAG TPA: ABC transporter permease [Chryseosolibacter sp.]|nr:ABC transporter permease [Chryseosolibacter sp.]
MIRNYLKVAIRAITRNKLSSFINIFGLALAMSCSLLIFLFIKDELAYDRYNDNAERIYRVTRDFLSPDGSVNLHLGHVAPPFGPLLKNDFGHEFEQVARTLQTRLTVSYRENGEEKKAAYEDNGFYAEPEILKIFTIPMVNGNPDKVLHDPFTMMISENAAKKYFGNENPIGKVLRIGSNYDMTVNGVFKNFPKQSHWHPEMLVAFSTLNDSTIYGQRGLETNFGNNSFGTYILANGNLDKAKIEGQFPAFLDKHMPSFGPAANPIKPSSFTHLFLQKVTDIHLHSQLDSEVETNGSMRNVYMMGVIAVFIILIACFNFINLSTARATKRAKEVGLRKVVGAFKAQLIGQYLSESILISMLALALCVTFSFIAVDWLNNFTSKELNLNFVGNFGLFGGLLAFAVIVGVLAGIYPAFIISSFKPAAILKGQQGSSKSKAGLRKFLVVAQFSISIVLIIATMITYQQLQYANNRELGYNKNQVVTLRFFGELAENYDAFYNELLKHSSIKNVSRSSRTPTGRLLDSNGTGQVQKGDSLENTNVVLKNIRVDTDFFDTYEVKFASGRGFSKAIPTDDSLAFVINESAATMMGVSPDDILTRDFQYGGVKGRVIGVVKDFHFESLHEPIVPIVFVPSQFYNRISVKIAGNEMQEGLQQIEKVWKEFLPSRPFEYSFLSEQYRQLYDAEQKQGQLFTMFAGLAILIACLGLFGLATFNTLQRVKEIGIRKVLGASVGNIVRLLSMEIIILVFISNLIAWPIAWYMMDEWLNGFAYRIDISIWMYAGAAFIAILIALLTVSSQTIKAAMSNPSNTLRYE